MTIPDYELVQKCGHGAYGDVWIARNRSGQWVALKIMENSEQVKKEFAGLVNYAKIGDSPYLIRILHIGEIGTTLYYTMEHADNIGTETHYVPATLADVLKRRKRFSAEETVELGRMMLEGLKTLHGARLVHRDIKPENILYVDGIPKLSDIGLVRSVSQTMTLGGTLGFIPPERLRAGSTGKGNADDLYALGKVLYCCLTGNSVECFPSFPPKLIDCQEYRELNRIILTACNRERFQRFKSTEEFQLALAGGISRKKRFLSLLFRCRYVAMILVVLTALCFLFLAMPSVTLPDIKLPEITLPTSLLETGRVTGWKSFDVIAYGTGVLYIPDQKDSLHRNHKVYELDGAPRRQTLVFQDDFRSGKS